MANTGQGAQTSLSKGPEGAVDTGVKRPEWRKQLPGVLSNPTPIGCPTPLHSFSARVPRRP